MNTSTNQTPIIVITSTIALLAALCVLAECLLAYRAIHIPPELNTLTGGLVGALTAMLVKTTPTETTPHPPTAPDEPVLTTIDQPPDQLIPVVQTETKPKTKT